VRLILLVLLFAGSFFVLRESYAFLAVNAPINATALVIEGWVPRNAVTSYVARCHSKYTDIYTIGGPTPADYISRDVSDTYAAVARLRLVRAGVPAEKVHVVPCWLVTRDRTYASAVALREWCRTNHVELKAFTVVSWGPHARRSRLLHEKASGPKVKVGVISLPNKEYDTEHWWRYSDGLKETVSEGAAYLYSRFFFSPE
jgi:uncharacterized SAM-binding protein YcdF (DUF218 family)